MPMHHDGTAAIRPKIGTCVYEKASGAIVVGADDPSLARPATADEERLLVLRVVASLRATSGRRRKPPLRAPTTTSSIRRSPLEERERRAC